MIFCGVLLPENQPTDLKKNGAKSKVIKCILPLAGWPAGREWGSGLYSPTHAGIILAILARYTRRQVFYNRKINEKSPTNNHVYAMCV